MFVFKGCGLPLTTEEGMQTCLVSQEEFECFGTRFSRTENTETNFTAFDLACETANFPAVTAGDVCDSCKFFQSQLIASLCAAFYLV